MSWRFFSNSWVFFMLKEFGSGARILVLSVNSFDNLYAGALRQLTTGRMGWIGLCIFIRPLMEGADGFILMYFHLWSLGMRFGLCLIVVLTCVWKVLVGSVACMWKSWFCINSCSLVSYCCVGSITIVFLLSALVIMASCSRSFFFIECTVLA